MPKSELREFQATTAAIRQRTLNFRLRLNLISRFLTRSQSRGWLPKLRNPRRNQYKPEDLYGFQKSSECRLLSAYSVYSKCRCLSSCIVVLHLHIILIYLQQITCIYRFLTLKSLSASLR